VAAKGLTKVEGVGDKALILKEVEGLRSGRVPARRMQGAHFGEALPTVGG